MAPPVLFIYLSQEDVLATGIEMPRVIEVVEEVLALHDEGKVNLPSKVILDLGERQRGRINAMPAYLGGDFEVCGIKWIAGFPPNPVKYGIPRAHALTILNSADTGVPLAIMDGTYISAMRRGAVTGVGAREDQAFDILKKAGCPTNGKRVHIPSQLVEEAIRLAPRTFTLYGRDPSFKVTLEDRRVHYEPMIGRLNIMDMVTGMRRRTTLEDVANLVRLADHLEHYTLLHSGAIMPHIEGVPDEVSHVHGYYTSVKNSSKVIKGVVRGKRKAKDCIRMASVIAGGQEALKRRPNIFTTCNVISPLQFNVEQTEGLIEYAKMGLPIDIASEPQSGATSPVSLAGTIVQQTAEILGMVVLAQLVNPGTPVLMGTVAAAMDLRNGMIALGGVEAAMMNVAHAQMAQFYQIPSRGTGSNTESKTLDMQAGYEKMVTLLLPALGGINMIFYPGTMDHALTVSLESLVIDHEICGVINRILEGISVTDEKVGVEVIDKVGPGGHFLNQKHTLKHLEEEHFLTKLCDRDSHEVWAEKGKPGIVEKAKEQVRKILKEHEPLAMDSAVEKELLAIIKEVEKRELGT